MTVKYEWDIETIDEYGDIIDHDFADKLKTHKQYIMDFGPNNKLVLVRSYYPGDGSLYKSWAYVTIKQNMFLELPKAFLDEYERYECKIPKRFIDEVVKHNKELSHD